MNTEKPTFYCSFQAWINEFLQWNKTDYNGVRVVHFRPDEIWYPDITLLNK